MTERIERLVRLANRQDLYAASVMPEFDPTDEALPTPQRTAKRLCEYILQQPVYLTEDNRFTGMLRFLGELDVPSDVFHRAGHEYLGRTCRYFYTKYRENLVVFEWQHAAPNYKKIIDKGMISVLEDIDYYKERHRFDKEKYQYLSAMDEVCRGIIRHSERCAQAHERAAEDCADPVRREELIALANACRKVPLYPCESFYEGLQCIIFCFQFLPDSVGTIDRALRDLYFRDIRAGRLTKDRAKELIAEFYVHLSNHTAAGTVCADRSAECHFAVGGYTETGEDGFDELSELMIQTLLEMDTRRPAISLRWTKKTPYEVLRFVLEADRKDPHKRFAFVNDEPRIQALMDRCGLSFSDAVKYTMVGCNEPSFPGAIWFGGETTNIARSMTNTLYGRRDEVIRCRTFEEFYAIYKEELEKDIARILYYNDVFNDIRAKDVNVLSAFLLDGCVESGTSPTQYSCRIPIGGFSIMGTTCVIDSLTVIKQFVFDEGRTDMAHLIDVLESNWALDPDLRTQIIKEAKFFGNDEPISNEMAQRFTSELYAITDRCRLRNGAKPLIGTLAGYHPHHMMYGAMTKPTPDGRYDGEGFMVGVGQTNGKDRNGIAALMNSVAQMDPKHILCGPLVFNMLFDEVLIKNDDYFERICRMIEVYFRKGGVHIQTNYISKQKLLEARETPELHPNLKVRVSGYSATFIQLPQKHQDEIIMRTEK